MGQATGRSGGKRERVLEAARELFLAYGLRGTSMEAIARQAGVAKPTLYAHFAGKDEVLLAIIEALLTEKLAAFERAMAQPGPVAQRVGVALAAEFDVVARALEGSPHRDELFAEHKRAAELMQRSDAVVLGRLEEEFAAAGVQTPARLAGILLGAAFGLVVRGGAGAALGEDIQLLARRLIEPEVEPGR